MEEGKYIYCIIELNKPQSFGPLGIGGRGDELHTIYFQNIAAVVSNSPIIKYSISRENMLAHEKAIEEVMKKHTVLPVRFATIAKDEEKVKKILEKEYDRFIDLLENMKGKKELGLKAIFKEDVIYKEILEKYRDIKILKDRLAVLPLEKTYYQQIEIGKMVEAASFSSSFTFSRPPTSLHLTSGTSTKNSLIAEGSTSFIASRKLSIITSNFIKVL